MFLLRTIASLYDIEKCWFFPRDEIQNEWLGWTISFDHFYSGFCVDGYFDRAVFSVVTVLRHSYTKSPSTMSQQCVGCNSIQYTHSCFDLQAIAFKGVNFLNSRFRFKRRDAHVFVTSSQSLTFPLKIVNGKDAQRHLLVSLYTMYSFLVENPPWIFYHLI